MPKPTLTSLMRDGLKAAPREVTTKKRDQIFKAVTSDLVLITAYHSSGTAVTDEYILSVIDMEIGSPAANWLLEFIRPMLNSTEATEVYDRGSVDGIRANLETHDRQVFTHVH